MWELREMKMACIILVGNTERMTSFKGLSRRWEDNIKVDPNEPTRKGVNCIKLGHDVYLSIQDCSLVFNSG